MDTIEHAPGLDESSGTVKNYWPEKGYGTIEDRDGSIAVFHDRFGADIEINDPVTYKIKSAIGLVMTVIDVRRART